MYCAFYLGFSGGKIHTDDVEVPKTGKKIVCIKYDTLVVKGLTDADKPLWWFIFKM